MNNPQKKGIQPIKTIPKNREKSASSFSLLKCVIFKWLKQLRALCRLYALRDEKYLFAC